ncbi:type IV secretion system protein VirB10 [Campylobacter fetus subsp. testudinum]|uniref:type IV secretion system protein VirB10 n=3 Tax=Campylobacter fetus TaxID=196 RepID=UPI000818A369|nr:type IV secretion system protein VirB10 [Campylobacter fetus]OCR95671.1 type IV secretion system protein VirB10 [Campylobacter fetus subsp. testudinum]
MKEISNVENVENNSNDLGTQSELEQLKISPAKIRLYIGLVSIIFVIFLVTIFFLKNFSFGVGNNADKKQDNKDLTNSVKQDKKFDNKPVETFQDVLKSREESVPMTIKKPKDSPTNHIYEAELVKAKKARIVKGAGITVIKNDSMGSSFGNNNNLAEKNFLKKPDTIFDFGQNGDTLGAEANNLAANGSGGDSQMSGDVYTPTQAKVSNFNQSLLLPKGAYIGCALKTKLVSTIKGGIACIVSNDVYSANGHTLLIEKGSTITGTFNSGQMNDGVDRLFVIWQEIRTPNNIVIPVYSGATDSLGASGVPGWVDHHYMQRFGAAIMLSVLDDAMGILANQIQNKTSNGNNNNNYYDYSQNTRENTRDIANTTLEKMIDIKPTLYKNQGDLVGVYVNRDIDFSKVYKIVLRRKK